MKCGSWPQLLVNGMEMRVAEERARIRKELEAAIEPEIRIVCVPGSRTEVEVLLVSYLRKTLHRICPEERAGGRSGKNGGRG